MPQPSALHPEREVRLLDSYGTRLSVEDCLRNTGISGDDRFYRITHLATPGRNLPVEYVDINNQTRGTWLLTIWDDSDITRLSGKRMECPTCPNLLACTLNGESKALEVPS